MKDWTKAKNRRGRTRGFADVVRRYKKLTHKFDRRAGKAIVNGKLPRGIRPSCRDI